MSNSIYNGDSKGFSLLCDGYVDYAKEVISRRSIPDLRDGLKPVGRRCIYGASRIKDKSLVKCLTLVGEISKLHPHGDSSVYEALCSMTDKNGTMSVPVFAGQGELGKVYSTGTPASQRYTKAKLDETAYDYLRDLDACNMIPAEEGDGFEPEVLPVRYPSVLVNGTSGMAVSVSTTIPSFNFKDVVDLTQEYLKTGEFKTVISPDFPTGGILVKDDTELAKLMHTGKGKIKIRAKVDLVGKDILVKEVPFGKTVESIIKNIQELDIQGIQSIQDSTDLRSDSYIKITCKTLKVQESVLLQLYKHRILQTSLSSNMLFVENEEPILTGVYGVIERWVAWREQVVTLKFQKLLNGIKDELSQLGYFIKLINNDEWRDKFVDLVVHKSKSDGKAYLKEIFEDISEDECSWIADRSISAFNNGGKYSKRYNDLLACKDLYTKHLNDVKGYIYEDLEDLKASRSMYFARKTEETYNDYRFSTSSNEVEDDSPCVFTLFENGFLKKTRDEISEDGIMFSIKAKANSTLIGFDCFGRVLRVFGNEIPFTSYNELGEYLPKYFQADGYEGYKVIYLGLLDGKKRMLVYRDGFVGFLDTSEWLEKKKNRIVQNGVDTCVYNLLLEVYEEEDFSKIGQYLVVADVTTGKVRLGVSEIANIREASRRSRAKVFSGKDLNLQYVACMGYIDLLKLVSDYTYFLNSVKAIGDRLVGDSEILLEGSYFN